MAQPFQPRRGRFFGFPGSGVPSSTLADALATPSVLLAVATGAAACCALDDDDDATGSSGGAEFTAVGPTGDEVAQRVASVGGVGVDAMLMRARCSARR